MAVAFVATLLAPLFGWKIAAKHKHFIRFQSQDTAREKIREAFTELGWALVRDEGSDMVARVAPTFRSWGELVSVHIRDGGADLRSECSFMWQGVDYGKNRLEYPKAHRGFEKEKMPNTALEPTASCRQHD